MKLKFALVAALIALPAWSHDLAFADLLSNKNMAELPELTLSSGAPIADGPLMLKSGTGYELEITADGSAELALAGFGFFRAI